jgi:hypothetical protein
VPIDERTFVGALMAVGAIGGLAGAALIGRLLATVNRRPAKVVHYTAMMLGLYVLECVAFSAGMCTQVFSVALAVLWGVLFGLWLRKSTDARGALRAAFFVSLYGCLPTVILCVLLTAVFAIRGGLLSVEMGADFGIPRFLPWPANTILGFCSVLGGGTLVLKTGITMGEVRWLVYRGPKNAPVKVGAEHH